jgi:uncharacterized membrane protein YkoI
MEADRRATALRSLHPPAVSLASAVRIVGDLATEGELIGVQIEVRDDEPAYYAFLSKGRDLHVVQIDVHNRAILGNDQVRMGQADFERFEQIHDHPERVSVSFLQAIERAQAASIGSWAASVILDAEEESGTYGVELVTPSSVSWTEVHAADGTLGAIGKLEWPQRNRTPLVVTSIFDSTASEDLDLTEPPAFSLGALIARAQARAPEARFQHAELGRQGELATCLVCFLDRNDLRFFELDAQTGAIRLEGNGGVDARELARMRRCTRSARDPIGPDRAIAEAVAAVPGSWARMLTLDGDTKPANYCVEVAAGSLVREVIVNAMNGKLVRVREPGTELADPDSDD